MLNNPLRYTDPTGHAQVDGGSGLGSCSTCTQLPTDPINPGPDPEDGEGGGGGHPPIILPETLPCGGMLTCNQPSLYNYLLPFTGGACEALLHHELVCNTNYSSYSPPVVGFDLSRIDSIEMVIDMVGLGTDGGTLLFPSAIKELQTIGFIVDVAGAEYQVAKATGGELHLGDLTLDLFFQMAEKHPITVARMGRAVPVVGIVGNAISIGANISNGFYIKLQTTIP